MLYKFFSKYYIKNKALCLITEDLDSSFLLCTGELHNPAQVTSMHWVLLLPSLKWEISPKHITVTSIKENPVRGHSMKIGQKSKVLKSDRLKRTYLLNTLSSVLRATSIYSVNICRMNELLFNKKKNILTMQTVPNKSFRKRPSNNVSEKNLSNQYDGYLKLM